MRFNLKRSCSSRHIVDLAPPHQSILVELPLVVATRSGARVPGILRHARLRTEGRQRRLRGSWFSVSNLLDTIILNALLVAVILVRQEFAGHGDFNACAL